MIGFRNVSGCYSLTSHTQNISLSHYNSYGMLIPNVSRVDLDNVHKVPRLRAHHTSSSKERMIHNKEFEVQKAVWFKFILVK